MRQVGDLWVWADAGAHRLMLGNRAAALAQTPTVPQKTTTTDLPEIKPAISYMPLGTYAVQGGPAVALRVALCPDLAGDPRTLTSLLGDLAVAAPAEITLDYSAYASGRQLWKDGRCLASGPLKGEGVAHGFNFYFELVRALLAHEPLTAILHGSGLRWGGRNLVFMGPSGSGKSTLAALLVAQGGQYLGDDLVALLGTDCRAHPLPFAPSIKQGAWPVLLPHYPALAEAVTLRKGSVALRFLSGMPFLPGRDAGPPDLLVFPRFSPGAMPRAVRLSPAETLLELSRSGLWLAPDAGETLIDWACRVPAIALRHTPDIGATQAILDAALAGDL